MVSLSIVIIMVFILLLMMFFVCLVFSLYTNQPATICFPCKPLNTNLLQHVQRGQCFMVAALGKIVDTLCNDTNSSFSVLLHSI